MGIFLALTRTSDPTRPTRRGPDPNRTMYGNEEGGYELSGIVRGGGATGLWRPRRGTVVHIHRPKQSPISVIVVDRIETASRWARLDRNMD